jgi:L-threonylcarbamoyladenylate synthase
MNIITEQLAGDFQRTIERGGIAIFPTDTLYGIACDPDRSDAIERIHQLKGRPPVKPSAVMYFSVARLLEDLEDELDGAVRELIERVLPGPFTLVVANPHRRFSASCADAREKLGLRVPRLGPENAALGTIRLPVMQTSANLSGAPDAASPAEIDRSILRGVDLVLDGGPLPGMGSTVADISELAEGRWRLLRASTPEADQLLAEAIGFPAQSD